MNFEKSKYMKIYFYDYHEMPNLNDKIIYKT